MYIDNHSIAMKAQYFKLEANEIETSIQNDDKNHSSQEVNKTSIDKTTQELVFNELSAKLTNEILKNINNTTIKNIRNDELQIISTYNESQELNFQTKAYVQAGNREIEIALDVSLSRSFTSQTEMTLSLEILQDPLVISLDGTLPILSSHKFNFDIDSDGLSDQISVLKENSGFLALDKNKNGTIDDGNELFGTKSGDGFKDLSAFDDDKNGWIDENDKVFDRLQVWLRTENRDKLIALGELGIGAIYLGNTQTPFDIKSETNELLGQIKKSGFFLFENGKAGIISQIDLAVQSKETLEKTNNITQDISKFRAKSIYDNQTNDTRTNEEDLLSKLESMLKKLKSKLAIASPDAKSSIQAQIAMIHAQIADLMLN